MFLQSIVNAVPPNAFSQKQCWEIFSRSETVGRLKERSVELMRKVMLGDNGIDKRRFAHSDLNILFEMDAESLNKYFEREAPLLARKALAKALEKAALRAQEIDALIICACTGYICPGISSHVAEQLGMRPDVHLQDLVGMGCGGAIPAMWSASQFLCAYPAARVAVIAVEICSAAFYMNDEPGVIISACLFGDGASATIWSMDDRASGLKCGDFDSLHQPENREILRFENKDGFLINRLHRSVPDKAAEAVRILFDKNVGDRGREVGQVISHGGGRDVIEAIEHSLPGHVLNESRAVLKNYGNVSSPSVLFALEHFLKNQAVEKDLWLTSFGAGFSCHCCRVGHA